jgi:hypothetical protein
MQATASLTYARATAALASVNRYLAIFYQEEGIDAMGQYLGTDPLPAGAPATGVQDEPTSGVTDGRVGPGADRSNVEPPRLWQRLGQDREFAAQAVGDHVDGDHREQQAHDADDDVHSRYPSTRCVGTAARKQR